MQAPVEDAGGLAVAPAWPACCRAMGLRRRLWLGIAEVGMAFAGLVVGYLVVGTLAGLVDVGPFQLLAGPLVTGAAAVFYGWLGPRWSEASLPEDERLGPAPMPPSSLRAPAAAGVVALGLVVALAGSMALGVVLELLGVGVHEQPGVLRITEGAQDGLSVEAIVLAVSALLLAPVAEEWLFRRLLFVRVRSTSGRWIAYGMSALCFAAIHNNPAGIVIYLWLGLVFAAVLERTGRLWAAIAVHLGNNAYVLAMLFFGADPGA
ncbi:MAG: CPBP family intramembrane metalloprotease [Myxococcales bacterium]|nr:CPBP family intramembrane metalloprotease [Myxococcales bacterium]